MRRSGFEIVITTQLSEPAMNEVIEPGRVALPKMGEVRTSPIRKLLQATFGYAESAGDDVVLPTVVIAVVVADRILLQHRLQYRAYQREARSVKLRAEGAGRNLRMVQNNRRVRARDEVAL